MIRAIPAFVVVVVAASVGCTDLELDGDEVFGCDSNADCPAGLLCATAIKQCVAEAIVGEAAIAVVGEAFVDAPRISRVEGFAVSTATVTFSKPPAADVTATIDGKPLPCSVDDAGPAVWRCSYDAREHVDERDGAYDMVVAAVDAAGNVATARARFELDTTAPALAPDSVVVRYEAVDVEIVRDVRALGPHTRAVVQLGLTEVPATTPTLSLIDADVDFVRDEARSAGPLQVFAIDGAALADVDDGHLQLRLTAADDVGNVAEIVLDEAFAVDVDGTAPAIVDVESAETIVFTRVPWGTRAAPTASFRVTGAAGAVDVGEAGGTVVVTSAETLSSTLLGTAAVADDGSFDVVLQQLDVPRVFVRVIDGAGNVGEVGRVRDVVWTASLGGRRRSDDFSNPHLLSNVTSFDSVGVAADLLDEPLRPSDLVDGDGFSITSRAVLRPVQIEANEAPARFAHSAGYLPRRKLLVLFGGIGAPGGAQLTDTFVLRNERWTIVGEPPPATGALAYDSERETLVGLLSNGETWDFDGDNWAQRGVAPLVDAGRGPIAWDPLEARLVSVQGTDTWVLDNDDSWRLLASPAPMAGFESFDVTRGGGSGAVLAFDGVNGHVILVGVEPGGSGAVYSLIDDVWTRIADAPAMSRSTAVENPLSGEVFFTCRVLDNEALRSWNGVAFVDGAANPDARVGCAGAFDIAERRLLVHGGAIGEGNAQNRPVAVTVSFDVDEGAGGAWRVVPTTTPVQMPHNIDTQWQYDSVLDRTVLMSARTTGTIFRRTSTWDGRSAVVGPVQGDGVLAFDGRTTRVFDGNTEVTLPGGARRQVALGIPFNSVAVYDEGADAAFIYSPTTTLRVRGDVVTTLTPTTAPPPRSLPALAYDAANDQVVLAAGGFNFNDAWAFADGTWRQLDDLPGTVASNNVQLYFDRARSVVVLYMLGRLFDLRGDSWVERDVDAAPRLDALAMFDERRQGVLFVGGLDFDSINGSMNRLDIAGARAGQAARFDLRSTGAGDDAVFDDVTIDVDAGASGAEGSGDVHGVDVLVWGANSFVRVGGNDAAADAPASFTLTVPSSSIDTRRDDVVIALRSAPTGPGIDNARLRSRTLELTLRYREP